MTQRPGLDQFSGCLLGLALGDAVGAPLEGLDGEIIYHSFGSMRDYLANPPVDLLCYTDDTQMTISVAETLIQHGHIDQDFLAQRFVANFDPRRGYGQGARQLIGIMADHGDWQQASKTLFPDGGSYGNGAAMRVAPVALLFCNDLDKVWEQARLSAEVTHAHEWGIEGAQLLAIAVALAAVDPQLIRQRLFAELRSRAKTEEFQWLLKTAARLTPDQSLLTLGNGLEAHRSVVTSITCFAFNPDDYLAMLVSAIRLGNDVDTLAAMAGAIGGARLGFNRLPAHLLSRLENAKAGKNYILELSEKLYQRYVGN